MMMWRSKRDSLLDESDLLPPVVEGATDVDVLATLLPHELRLLHVVPGPVLLQHTARLFIYLFID